MMKRIVFMVTVALVMALMLALAGPALATIHPIVESVDCANPIANENHPLGDVAEVPGATPGDQNPAGQPTGQGNNELRALIVTSDGFNDFSSPAWFGHKLNDECGTAQGPK
jgi:hypothetical protein